LTSWDKTNLYDTDGNSWKSGIANSTDETSHAGTYHSVLSYGATTKLVTDLATNYKLPMLIPSQLISSLDPIY